jgi:carbonic anhydrase
MNRLSNLLENNRAWSANIAADKPGFFTTLSEQQSPDYLWIGCSDSRVPANEIVGLLPGELFVHRNVANVVVHTDLNCLSVIQYAVEVLGVEHIIVCGHYGCGGVQAALDDKHFGLIDNWLRHIQDVRNKHAALLAAITDPKKQARRLCELNVIEQVVNVCRTNTVRSTWEQGKDLVVHGWIYGLSDGLVRDLGISSGNYEELNEKYRHTVNPSAGSTIAARYT